jgi:hypothetical protein
VTQYQEIISTKAGARHRSLRWAPLHHLLRLSFINRKRHSRCVTWRPALRQVLPWSPRECASTDVDFGSIFRTLCPPTASGCQEEEAETRRRFLGSVQSSQAGDSTSQSTILRTCRLANSRPGCRRSPPCAMSALGPSRKWRPPELAAGYWVSSAATVAPGPQGQPMPAAISGHARGPLHVG